MAVGYGLDQYVIRFRSADPAISRSMAAAIFNFEPEHVLLCSETIFEKVDMGGWVGGQADYVFVPYADFNLINFPDKDQAMSKIRDLTMLSDILPTGFDGAVSAGAGVGSIVHVAGSRAGGSCGDDMIPDRLKHAASVGFTPIDLTKSNDLGERIEDVVGKPEVDCAVDAVAFEARAHGKSGQEAPATVLNSLMSLVRASGVIGIPGLYVTDDPGPKEDGAKTGNLSIRIGLGWAKSYPFYTGQTPLLK
jgi:glutathione-independent formaldehyde dehydrogenase